MTLNGNHNRPETLPERVEGWLDVLDVPASGDVSLLINKTHLLQWRRMYCVLRVSSHRLSHSRNEDRGLQKKSQGGPTVLRIGGTLDELLKSSDALSQLGKDDDLEGRHEKNLSTNLSGSSALDDNSTNKFISFINRTSSQIKGNLRRTRSSSKLDRRKADAVETSADVGSNSAIAQGSFLKRTRSFSRLSKKFQSKWKGLHDRNDSSTHKEKSLRTAQSHESLVGHQPIINLTTFDSHTDIRVIHQPSLLARDNCFLISTDKTSRFYSSPNSLQMCLWLHQLKRSLEPIRTRQFRNLKSINVLISEAKNLSNKLRYFCELAIDGQVYGRTTTKAKGEMLFWGETFHLRNAPALDKAEKLTINVFQDIEKKKKKDLSILIGCVSLQLSEMDPGFSQEKWFPLWLVSGKSGGNREAAASVRIKVKYESLDVLPLNFYYPLLEYLHSNYMNILAGIEGVLSAKEKEDLGQILVNIFGATHHVEKFLVDVVVAEVNKQDKLQNLLRSNSIASKSIDAFMKLVSEKYLKETLGSIVASLVDPSLNLEVDNISNGGELQRRQEKLLKFCNSTCFQIFASADEVTCFPIELKQVFTSLRKELMLSGHGDEVINQVISSCFFLRFICPAILSPSLFGLTRVLPQDKEARNCTLVAKAIQGLANFSRFGEGKEEAMIFLNELVDSQTSNLRKFIYDISNMSDRPIGCAVGNAEITLDLPRELCVLHLFFENVFQSKQNSEANFCKVIAELTPVLSEINNNSVKLKNSLKSADSLDDLMPDEGMSGRRRTMREIQESGSYVSFTSLQNISDQGHSNDGFIVPCSTGWQPVGSLSMEVDPFDRFSVSTKSCVLSHNNSSSCLDVRPINACVSEINPLVNSIQQVVKTSSGIFIDVSPGDPKKFDVHCMLSGGPSDFPDLKQNLQQTLKESSRTGGPQRATLVFAAETEIDSVEFDCCSSSWRPLSPQGNLINYPQGDSKEVQITFNIPRQGIKNNDVFPLNVSSLKRPPKEPQQPLIFSNPGFGMKSSLSQNSLKMDTCPPDADNSFPGTKTTSLPLGCEVFQKINQTATTIVSPTIFESRTNPNNTTLENVPLPSVIQSSKSMEFSSRPTWSSTSDSSPSSDALRSFSTLKPVPLSRDVPTFSGRGDIGFNIKAATPHLNKVSGVRTIPRKIDGNKEQEVASLKQLVASLKSTLADTKWKLQQECEAKSRMESEYMRKLRISEQERKKMEVNAFEDKKMMDLLKKHLKEEQKKVHDLEKKMFEVTENYNKSQRQTGVSKVAKKWPNPVLPGFGEI